MCALSCDGVDSHKGWIQDINSTKYAGGRTVAYPIIADEDRSLAKQWGMIDPDEQSAQGLPMTCRGACVRRRRPSTVCSHAAPVHFVPGTKKRFFATKKDFATKSSPRPVAVLRFFAKRARTHMDSSPNDLHQPKPLCAAVCPR